jgi:hypothetical protein
LSNSRSSILQLPNSIMARIGGNIFFITEM